MSCEEIRGRLDASLDGELEPAEAAALSRHLRACAACAAEALDRVQLKRFVAAAGRRYVPSADLRATVIRSARPPRPGTRWSWQVLAAPAALLLIVSLATGLYLGSAYDRRDRLGSELADLHVAALASVNPVDVVSSDRHTVKPWFQGKLPFTFEMPDLEGSAFTLVGGRLASFAQAPAAHLIFGLRQHRISVFIFQDAAARTAGVPSGSSRAVSFNLVLWQQDGLRYAAIGDAGAQDLEALARLLRGRRS